MTYGGIVSTVTITSPLVVAVPSETVTRMVYVPSTLKVAVLVSLVVVPLGEKPTEAGPLTSDQVYVSGSLSGSVATTLSEVDVVAGLGEALGPEKITGGEFGPAVVVNEKIYGAARLFPARSAALMLMFTVYVVDAVRPPTGVTVRSVVTGQERL